MKRIGDNSLGHYRRAGLGRDEARDGVVRVRPKGEPPGKFLAAAVKPVSGRFGVLTPRRPVLSTNPRRRPCAS